MVTTNIRGRRLGRAITGRVLWKRDTSCEHRGCWMEGEEEGVSGGREQGVLGAARQIRQMEHDESTSMFTNLRVPILGGDSGLNTHFMCMFCLQFQISSKRFNYVTF